MELPSDPANLVYGIYDKMGRDLTKERLESKYEYWALSDDSPSKTYDNETPFDMEELEW